MVTDNSKGQILPDNPRSPLPGAALLDEAIERHLAVYDLVIPEVRRAAGVIAHLVQRLAPAQALAILAFAHRVSRRTV